MTINVQNICGFASTDREILVSSEDGRPVYWRNNKEGKRITFNLPVGKWETENEIERLCAPLKYITPDLPYPTYFMPVKPFEFHVVKNPNKCTIDFDSDKDFAHVYIDHELASTDIPFLQYVLYHENGHFNYGGKKAGTKEYYEEEHKCDIYAAKHMLERGYNPTQCNYAGELCLTEHEDSRQRKDRLFKWLSKVKCVEPRTANFEHTEKKPSKVYTTRYAKTAFDKPNGKLIGDVKKGEYLGDLIKKTKDKDSDSLWFEFKYPKKFIRYMPNSMGYTQGHSYFILAEPDEIGLDAIHTFGDMTDTVIVAEKGIQAVKEVGKSVLKVAVTILVLYVIASIVIKKI